MRMSEEVVTDRSQTGPKSGPGANPDSSLGFMLPGTPLFIHVTEAFTCIYLLFRLFLGVAAV